MKKATPMPMKILTSVILILGQPRTEFAFVILDDTNTVEEIRQPDSSQQKRLHL